WKTRAAISQHSQWSCWETVGSRHPILYLPVVAAMAEGGSVQADISPITAAASVYALLTLNIWEKSPPSSTRCSSPLRERRSELPSLTDSTPTSSWTHS